MYSPRTGKTVRGQVDSVDIKQELVLQCGIADAGQRARAGVGEPVARGIGLDQRSEQAGVDVFDAHAGICDAGKRDLHQIVAGLAVGRADQGIGIACRFRQSADVADGEDDVAGAIANQRADAVDRGDPIGLGAADGEVQLRNSEQRRRRIYVDGATTKASGRIERKLSNSVRNLEEIADVRVVCHRTAGSP